MTVYKNTDGIVVGQPMSPFFGAQCGQQGPGAIVIEQPTSAPTTGMQATGVQMTMLEACSRGLIPRNSQLSTIAGQSVSAGISALQGDSVSLDEAMTSGNGAQTCAGVAVAPNAQNNSVVTTMGINNQVFVEGVSGVGDAISTGPTPTNTESVVSAPLPGSTTTANVTLLAGVYAG